MNYINIRILKQLNITQAPKFSHSSDWSFVWKTSKYVSAVSRDNPCSARLMTTSQEHCKLYFGAIMNIYPYYWPLLLSTAHHDEDRLLSLSLIKRYPKMCRDHQSCWNSDERSPKHTKWKLSISLTKRTWNKKAETTPRFGGFIFPLIVLWILFFLFK